MSNFGMGVMLGMLGGNAETVEAYNKAKGRTISSALIDENKLVLEFADGYAIEIYDDGQSCCEHRYMNTDDDLLAFVGAVFSELEIREGGAQSSEYEETKESQFLLVHTTAGTFTCANYNEHNGYYGGFWLVARERNKS